MLNTAQQTAARASFVDMIVRDAFPNAGSVEASCAYLSNVALPVVAGGLFALPDYTSKRPDESEAIEYAVKLVKRYEDDDRAYCLTSKISDQSPEAFDIAVAFGPWVAVVTVWLENGKLYGEY